MVVSQDRLIEGVTAMLVAVVVACLLAIASFMGAVSVGKAIPKSKEYTLRAARAAKIELALAGFGFLLAILSFVLGTLYLLARIG